MLDFQISTQIFHECISMHTFELIKEFLTSGEVHQKNSKNYSQSLIISYDEEFQLIQYNFDRKVHMTLEELFQYSDDKINFESVINSILEIVKEQNNKQWKNSKFSKFLSIQNLDSQKIWLEIDQKQTKVCNFYILNFISKVENGKNYEDIEHHLNYLQERRNHNRIIKYKKEKEKKSLFQQINKQINSSENFCYSDQFFNFHCINQQIRSFYLGEQYNLEKNQSCLLEQLQKQFEMYIVKKVEYLRLKDNQLKAQSLFKQLEDIIRKENGLEANLHLIIIKLIQKHNLFEEFFSRIEHQKSQLYQQFKQYIRELIYKSVLEETHQTFLTLNKIVIYLYLLSFKKSEADLRSNIKSLIIYAHEKLAIFKYAWSGRILSDQEILQQFLQEQMKIIQSRTNKLINQDQFVLILLQSEIYKDRVEILERGLDTLKQHLKIELSILAKEYFDIYEKYLQKEHKDKVKEVEIMSKIFLKITKQQLNQINKQQN